MNAWHETAIKELCELIVDCVNKTAPTTNSNTPYKMLRTTNVRNGWIDTESVRHVDEETYRKWTRRAVPQRNDIILTREAPLGEVGLLRTDDYVFLGQRLMMYRADRQKSDPRFLLYSLMSESVQAQLRSFGSGATVEHVRVPDCERLIIFAPDVDTQRCIGGFLGTVDDLIENSRRRIGLLERMTRTIYREWFVHFRYPGCEDQNLVSSDLGFIPHDWRVIDIKSACSYLNRGIAPKYAEDGPYLVLNQKCIRDGRLTLDKARRQSKSVPEHKLIHRGDVLINSTGVGTLGRVAQVYAELEDTTVDSHITIARPRRDIEIDWFGLSLLALESTFESRGVGSTGQTELNRDAIGRELLVLPPADLQRRFGDVVGSLRHLDNELAVQAEVMIAIRDCLLPKLVGGQVDVASLNLDSLV